MPTDEPDITAPSDLRADPQPSTSALQTIKTQLQFAASHAFELYGLEICEGLMVAIAFVRLNALGLVYLAMLGVFLGRGHRIGRKIWQLWLLLLGLLVTAQYASAVGLPGSKTYPWEAWTNRHYAGNVLFRWLFLPPVDDESSTSDKHVVDNAVARAPGGWTEPLLLSLDFALLMACSLQLRELIANPDWRQYRRKVRQNALWLSTSMVHACLWLALLFVLLAALSRSDLFTLVYILLVCRALAQYSQLFSPKLAVRAERLDGLLWALFTVLLVHMIWVLPAAMVDWASVSSSVLDLVDLLGLRYGLDMVLLSSDPRLSVWHSNHGLVFDILAFVLLLFLRRLLLTNLWQAAAEQFSRSSVVSAQHSWQLLEASLEMARTQRQRDEQRSEAGHEVMRLVKARAAAGRTIRTDMQTARWFASSLGSAAGHEFARLQEEDVAEANKQAEEGAGDKRSAAGAAAAPSTAAAKAKKAAALGGSQPSTVERDVSHRDELLQTEHPDARMSTAAARDATAAEAEAAAVEQDFADKAREAVSSAKGFLRRMLEEYEAALQTKTECFRRVWHAGDELSSDATPPPNARAGDVPGIDETDAVSTAAAVSGPASSTRSSPPPSSHSPPSSPSPSSSSPSPPSPSSAALLGSVVGLLYYRLLEQSQVLVFLLMILNVLVHADLLSVVFPMVLFGWGLMSRPMPSFRFWRFVRVYTAAVLLLRYVFQFRFWGTFTEPALDDQICSDPELDHAGCHTFARTVGLARLSDQPIFARALLAEVFLLLAVFLHDIKQHRLGFDRMDWTLAFGAAAAAMDEEQQAAEMAAEMDLAASKAREDQGGAGKAARNKGAAAAGRAGWAGDGVDSGDEDAVVTVDEGNEDCAQTDEYIEIGVDDEKGATGAGQEGEVFCSDDLLDAGEREAGGGGEDGDGSPPAAEATTGVGAALGRVKHFYRHLWDTHGADLHDYYVAMFLVEFVALFVILFGWNGFQKADAAGVSSATDFIQQNNIPTQLLAYILLQFLLVIVDRAIYLLRSLVLKLVLQYGMLLLIHMLVFFALPSTTGRSFHQNTPIIVWYLFNVAYFWLSAAQIRSQYPLSVLRNIMTAHCNTVWSLLFSIYLAIPFLFEMRSLLDWTCTATTLTLMDWFKMEDIQNQLYINKNRLREQAEEGRRTGQRQALKEKLLTGVGLTAVLILVLWCPLLIMSIVQQKSVPNPPISATVSFSINTYEPVFVMRAVPKTVSNTDYSALRDMNTAGYVQGYGQDDIQRTRFAPQSQQIWDISPSSKASLRRVLEKGVNISVTFSWDFERAPSTGISTISTGSNTLYLEDHGSKVAELLQALDGNLHVDFADLFPSYLHLDASGYTTPSSSLPGRLGQAFASANLSREETDGLEWWTLEQTSQHELPSSDETNSTTPGYPRSTYLEIITFCDQVIPPKYQFLSSYGIVGL